MKINELLAYVKKNNASDLHIISKETPAVRIDGDIRKLSTAKLSKEDVHNMLQAIMTEEQLKIFETELEIDFAIKSEEISSRFRVNAFHNINGPAVAIRIIPERVLSLEELNAPSILKKLSTFNKGLILVTGPTGSGKSTTLAAMVNHINLNSPKHIVTIEDPIEFIHKPQRAIINQRELGTNTKSFAQALKSSMREDPDVILIGEMRDKETISLALTAAETGHLVFGTLHTSSSAKTIDRVIDVFPPHDKDTVRSMLSSSLQAVIAQTLIKKADSFGRVAAHEILIANSAVRNLIRENKIPQITSLQQINKHHGMTIMKDVVYNLLSQNIIDNDEAKKVINELSGEDEEKVKL
ncbi:MAG: type IV pilus twitching motility protein PilT, partial [Pseudomonadota bacterium]